MTQIADWNAQFSRYLGKAAVPVESQLDRFLFEFAGVVGAFAVFRVHGYISFNYENKLSLGGCPQNRGRIISVHQ